MADMRELYQEIILDHNKSPRNFKKLEPATHTAEGYNPLCGDHYTLYMNVEDDTIREIAFQGSGCAISKASASVMSQLLKGKNRQEAEEWFQKFRGMILGERKDSDDLGKAAVFAGVAEFPSRVKCALLAWHTMSSALKGEQTVTTE